MSWRATPWPGKRHMNVESMFEYGSRAGFWRLWRMFTARKLPVTVFGVATALARNPDSGRRDARSAMGDRQPWPQMDRLQGFLRSRRARPNARGDPHPHARRPASGRSAGTPGAVRCNTLKLVLEEGGFLYSSDSYADDLPYWVNGPKGPHLIIPYTLDANDMRFINAQGFANGDEFFSYLRDSFDVLYAEGETRAEDDVGRPALPAGRPAGPRRRALRASSTISPSSTGSGSRRGSTSRGIGISEHRALAANAPVRSHEERPWPHLARCTQCRGPARVRRRARRHLRTRAMGRRGGRRATAVRRHWRRFTRR